MASKGAADDETLVHTEPSTTRTAHILSLITHSPGLGLPLEQALSPPLRVRAEMVGQLATNLLHGSERVGLLSNTQIIQISSQ